VRTPPLPRAMARFVVETWLTPGSHPMLQADNLIHHPWAVGEAGKHAFIRRAVYVDGASSGVRYHDSSSEPTRLVTMNGAPFVLGWVLSPRLDALVGPLSPHDAP
jgi:hypothetical protein